MTRIPATLALATLAAVALAAFALALGIGSIALDPMTVLRALAGGGDLMPRTIVHALLQVLLRNPLADPYVLGVSGGAAVGALAAMLLGAAAWLIPAGAFAGAFISTLLVFALARGSGAWSPTRLLLTGVIVAAGWGAGSGAALWRRSQIDGPLEVVLAATQLPADRRSAEAAVAITPAPTTPAAARSGDCAARPRPPVTAGFAR